MAARKKRTGKLPTDRAIRSKIRDLERVATEHGVPPGQILAIAADQEWWDVGHDGMRRRLKPERSGGGTSSPDLDYGARLARMVGGAAKDPAIVSTQTTTEALPGGGA